jgi:hypothetical protein
MASVDEKIPDLPQPSTASTEESVKSPGIPDTLTKDESNTLPPDPEPANRAENSPPPIPVPLLKRRGLLAQATLIPEVENARAYSRRTKWILTWILSFSTLIAPIGTSIFYRKSILCVHPFVRMATEDG